MGWATALSGAFVITPGPWPSIPTSWPPLIVRAPATSACSEPPVFSNVIAAGATPATSPISGASPARWPPAPPEKTAPRASDCSAEARSSRYSATFQPPSVIRFGERTAITAFRSDRSTPSLLPRVTCHASSTSQLSLVAAPSHTQLQLTSQLHTSKYPPSTEPPPSPLPPAGTARGADGPTPALAPPPLTRKPRPRKDSG